MSHLVSSCIRNFNILTLDKAHGKWQNVAIKKYFIIEKMQHIVCYQHCIEQNCSSDSSSLLQQLVQLKK